MDDPFPYRSSSIPVSNPTMNGPHAKPCKVHWRDTELRE